MPMNLAIDKGTTDFIQKIKSIVAQIETQKGIVSTAGKDLRDLRVRLEELITSYEVYDDSKFPLIPAVESDEVKVEAVTPDYYEWSAIDSFKFTDKELENIAGGKIDDGFSPLVVGNFNVPYLKSSFTRKENHLLPNNGKNVVCVNK
ncbi:MAG: hypothetical protein LBT09_10650 [Planctomycetaceae bacterium]|jgi:hypothetical protein|nr:hypothetical protein [Planctomycetaceae bacterium]